MFMHVKEILNLMARLVQKMRESRVDTLRWLVFIIVGLTVVTVCVYSVARILWAGPLTDEQYTYIHTFGVPITTMLTFLHEGMDVSYTHSVIIWFLNVIIGQSIYVQRFFSFFCVVVSVYVFWQCLRHAGTGVLPAAVCSVAILVGSLAIQIGSNNRFYSLLLLTQVVTLLYVTKRLSQHRALGFLSCLALFAFGFFTQPIFILFGLALGAALGFVWWHFRTVLTRTDFLVALSSFASAAGLYYVVGYSARATHGAMMKYSLAHAGKSPLPLEYFATATSPWNGWPNFPMVPWQIEHGCVFFGLVLLALIIFRKRGNDTSIFTRSRTPSSVFLLYFGAVCLVAVLGQVILSHFFPLSSWSSRYYVPFMLGLVSLAAGLLLMHKPRYTQWWLLIAGVGLFFDASSYLFSVSQLRRDSDFLKGICDREVFAPRASDNKPDDVYVIFGDLACSRFYGYVYMFTPQRRTQIRLVLPSRWRGNNWLTMIRDNYPQSNYVFADEISHKEFTPSKVVTSKIDFPSFSSVGAKELGWEGLVILEGSSWRALQPVVNSIGNQ